MNSINVEEINEMLLNFAKERKWSHYHTPKHLSIALSIESSELLERFQWKDNESSEKVKEDKRLMKGIKEEIADVLIYLCRLSSILDINLHEAVRDKFILNEEKYPKELSYGPFVKYSDREIE